ncbi:MAG: SufE family protein [Gammaproteobacteria bacterium]|nr:SufE family protein [Gammaproteobacteria bacterium]MCY4357188.1 SufE family protein [Gammaproteobacteria bacterium]
MSTYSENQTISSDDIRDTLGFFDSWEDRYKYIIDLGKDLPELPASKRTADRLVHGCQSNAWIDEHMTNGRLQLAVDSDAFIVKGLLYIVRAAFNNKTPQEILDFDIEQYFNELDLMNHLSATRGNGLRSLVSRIQEIAHSSQDQVNSNKD